MKLLLALALLALPCRDVFAATAAVPAPAANPAAVAPPPPAAEPAKFHMAVIIALQEGVVEIQQAGGTDWTTPKAGDAILPGSTVRTKGGGKLTLLFTDGTKLRLGPNANFKLEEATPSKVAIFIGLGKLESWVKKLAGRTFQARNPVAVASVRGTDFVMDVISPTEVMMDLFSGNMDVTDNFGRMTPMVEGQRVEASASAGAEPPKPVPPEVKMEAAPAAPPAIEKAVAAAAAGLALAETPAPVTAKAAAPAAAAPAEAEAAPAEVAAEETTAEPATTETTAPNVSQETSTVSDSAPK